MDASRLLEVLKDVEADAAQYLPVLEAVSKAYLDAQASPSVDSSVPITEAMNALATHVKSSLFLDYPPSKWRILAEIGGFNLVGSLGAEALERQLKNAVPSGSAWATIARDFQKEVAKFRQAARTTANGLESIGIKPHKLEQGNYEINVLIPSVLTDGTLTGLSKQAHRWNRAIRGFAQAVDDSEPELRIRDIGTGSNFISVDASEQLAILVAKVIDWICKTYAAVLEIRKKRQELQATLQKAGQKKPESDETVQQATNHEKALMNDAIEHLTEEIFKEAGGRGKGHHLKKQLKVSVTYVVELIDNDGAIETQVPTPETAPADLPSMDEIDQGRTLARLEAQKRDLLELAKRGAQLSCLPSREHPILQITAGDMEPDGEAEKAGGKKN